ncbi:hypothetical protein RJ639_036010 [Escallonia herrerae]|uniref:Uncharacterized protein n=1 Tax=Escallonia herrerae TaxID=1293975 RepID=A0AA88WPC2_9ASTE|nr:hypothetical protein RJ639_036010 [Escallonia herrerae]
MSLSLLQGYSSAEDDQQEPELRLINSSDEDDDDSEESDDVLETLPIGKKPSFELPKPSSSLLPSAFDAFSKVNPSQFRIFPPNRPAHTTNFTLILQLLKIAGPPEFLNNCIEGPASAAVDEGGQRWRHGRRRNRKEKKHLPAGAVMEAKAQLVGIHERVRSDAEGNLPQASSVQPNGSSTTTQAGVKRVASATNPSAEDASELLRMCLSCGVPKTYSNARGMVCPQCGDRPPADTDKEGARKKGSLVKDKEKSKRMKGQSSHATWKSETEMQLRQQFD